MDVSDCISARRSVRCYAQRDVEDEKLRCGMLDAAQG